LGVFATALRELFTLFGNKPEAVPVNAKDAPARFFASQYASE
jgi:hypothetical protein